MPENQNKEFMELAQEFIVLAIPDDTVELVINAKIYVGHELREVTRKMDFPEVRAAIREAQNGYIPSDALFSLVPTGRDKITDLVEKYMRNVDEYDL